MTTEANAEQLTLELTVDRGDLERQLGKLFPAFGGLGGGGGAGGKDTKTQRDSKKSLSPLVKLGGIALGIAALVKVSKVSQTLFSSFRDILGAYADVFLAQFMPLIAPALQGLASAIPQFTEAIRPISGAMEKLVAWLGGPFSKTIAKLLERLGLAKSAELTAAEKGAAQSVMTPGRSRVASDIAKLSRMRELAASRTVADPRIAPHMRQRQLYKVEDVLPLGQPTGQRRVLESESGGARLEAASQLRSRGLQEQAVGALTLVINIDNATPEQIMNAVRTGMDQLGYNPNDSGFQLGSQN